MKLAFAWARFAVAVAWAPMVMACLSFHRGAMRGEPDGATFADVAGARVRYLDEGAAGAPTVVLLHGFASSLETWELVRPALVAAGYRVLALDLKGFGWTDRPPGDYSPEAQARLVLELMDQRGIEHAAVVGHSWGASVALAMALIAPARVTRLALYDAWAFEEQLPTFFHWARASGLGEVLFWLWYDERADERISIAFFDPRLVSEKLVEDVDRSLARPGTKAAALASVRGQRYRKLEKRYREITVPTLLLWGREDRVTTLAYGERLARLLPGARLEIYPRCGHFPMLEAAAASTADLLTFLGQTAAAGRDEPDERDERDERDRAPATVPRASEPAPAAAEEPTP